MAGLDRNVVQRLNWTGAVQNIVTDSRTDFILSPQFDIIYQKNSEKLIDQTTEALKNGRYHPRLPITFSVLKTHNLTRPGSILEPADRLVYQTLVEAALPNLEAQMDRSRAFSQVPSRQGGELFEPTHAGWEKFQNQVADICSENAFVLKADVSNYFETIPQHPLINLISSTGVSGEIVNLLEELLLAFRQRSSAGIIQGIFPSDVLGNFYLSDFDGDCALQNIPSARYVDDIFAGFENELDAQRSLLRMIERLRQNGLYLNPNKTSIAASAEILHEEQEIDNLFEEARSEIEDEVELLQSAGYGFQGDWINGEEIQGPEDIKLQAVNTLLEYEPESTAQLEKIHRFCLPILRGAGDESAIHTAIEGFKTQPHLSRLYASYLTVFTKNNAYVREQIERLILENGFFSDYQRMYVIASIMNTERIDREVVDCVLRWIENAIVGPETRAICVIFVAKFGTAVQKRSIRLRYENEPSEYVRSAILFSAQFLNGADKRSAKQAWGGQSSINAQISDVI